MNDTVARPRLAVLWRRVALVALTLPAGVVAGLTTSFALMQGLLAALFYTWRAVY